MRVFISLAAAAFTLAGCATAPDPAKVCTAEWIKPRAQSAISDVEKDMRSVINILSKSISKGKSPGLVDMYRLDRLSSKLKSNSGIKDLRMLGQTCNDPEFVSTTLRKLMKEQGLSDKLIGFIQAFPAYQDLIKEGAASKP